MNYALVGYGRMGKAVERRARARGHECVAVIEIEDSIDGAGRAGAEVAFEFTLPGSAERNVLALIRAGIPTVCGTTGWRPGPELRRELDGSPAGLVLAPNFSVGMNLFFRLTAEAGRLVGALGLHEPFVTESHHRGKRDVPSGTARRLASLLLEADPRLESVHEGNPSEPLGAEVLQVASSRAGHEPGTHTVGFDGEHELITLRHQARGREGFALGAVLAGEWLGGRRGLHDFGEVLEGMLQDARSANGREGGTR